MIKVKNIRGKGRGIFATEDIKAGTIIEKSHYLKVPKIERDIIINTFLGNYVFELPNGDIAIALGTISLYNHNRRAKAVVELEGRQMSVRLRKNVKAGQEITINYGWEPDNYKE